MYFQNSRPLQPWHHMVICMSVHRCLIFHCPTFHIIDLDCRNIFSFFSPFSRQRNIIYARVDSALHRIRDTSEVILFTSNLLILAQSGLTILFIWCQTVQTFAAEHLKTPLGEPVKGKKNKTTTELWLEKFYKKTTNLPEPFPHELVERLEKYLDVSHSTCRYYCHY